MDVNGRSLLNEQSAQRDGLDDFNKPDSPALKWVWEIHKNCDQLLHQRLAAFTTAQAMTLAAFTVLTVARFQANDTMKLRIPLLENARLMVAFFGLLIAIFGWAVTYPMLVRLKYLNARYLNHNEVYKGYLDAVETLKLPFGRAEFPFKFYRAIIPLWLPAVELVLWIGLLTLTGIGINRSG